MKELLANAEEFLKSGKEDLEKGRFNVAVSNFFKAIVILCDYLIYKEIKAFPKSHTERFTLLRRYFKNIYEKISELFNLYVRSYNIKLKREDAIKMENYANEFKNFVLYKR